MSASNKRQCAIRSPLTRQTVGPGTGAGREEAAQNGRGVSVVHADSGPARKGRSVSFRLSTGSVQHSIHTDMFQNAAHVSALLRP